MAEVEQPTHKAPIRFSNRTIHPLFKYLVVVLVIVAQAYAFINRSLYDHIKYSFYMAVCAYVLLLLIWFVRWVKRGFIKVSIGEVLIGVIAPFVATVGFDFYYSIGVFVKDIYLLLISDLDSSNLTKVITISVVLFSGSLLFYFRLKLRSVYGFTETLVGLVVAVNRASAANTSSINDSTFYLAILTASVYLVVRGLDNIHQGLTKDPADPIGIRVYNLLFVEKASDEGRERARRPG